jgi:hypothetical protein
VSRLRLILVATIVVLGACADAEVGADVSDATTTTARGDSPSASSSATSSAPAAPPSTVLDSASETVLPALLAEVTVDWGTDWSKRTVDLQDFRVGVLFADPRDIIPPLDAPTFTTVASAEFEGREPGMIVVINGDARFYPLQILNLHEVVNDEIGGQPVAVTYCPLCNSAVVLDRRVPGGQELTFGTSGLLRNSDLVMWDRQTESLWQQITGEAIVGELAGTSLEMLPSSLVRFADFAAQHPGGLVLSPDTGIYGAYGVNPYVGYSTAQAPDPNFFRGEYDERLPALERVIGVNAGGEDRAFPFSVMAELRVANDVVGGVPVVVFWGAPDTADALDAGRVAAGRSIGTGLAFLREVDGDVLEFSPADSGADLFHDSVSGSTWNLLGLAVDGPMAGSQLEPALHTNSFWFAWAAFHPEGSIASLGAG